MTEKGKLIDVSKCIGCRACQLACKQWNGLPANQMVVSVTDQHAPDLQPNTWTLIRFQEVDSQSEGLKWLFRKDGCMHCKDASCVKVCPSRALFYSDMGTVGSQKERCIGCKACIAACPFHIPRYDSVTDKVYKCDLCLSRIQAELQPACVKACPTGALTFGDKDAMIKKAYVRVKKLGGDANVYGDKFVDGTHVTYVLQFKPEAYSELPIHPKVPLSVIIWKDLLKPLSLLAAGGVLGGAFFHYMIHGPKVPDDQNGGQDAGNTG